MAPSTYNPSEVIQKKGSFHPAIAFNPLWVGLLTPLISKEKIKRTTSISILISILGAVIIGAEDFTIGSEALSGDFLALMGGICAAFYLLLGRNLCKKISTKHSHVQR